MGLNLPHWFLPIMAVAVLVAVGACIVWGTVRAVRSARTPQKQGDKKTYGYYIVTLLCVAVMFISWIVNIGWYRIILTWIPIPLIHTIAFVVIDFKAATNVAHSDKLKKYIPLSWATYLAAYLLFPDGGDEGTVRVFFNLIQNDVLCTVAMCASIILFAFNVVILSLEYDINKKSNIIK